MQESKDLVYSVFLKGDQSQTSTQSPFNQNEATKGSLFPLDEQKTFQKDSY